MEKTEKYKLLGVLIRGFFEAFASGIIDSEVADAKEKFLPKTVKRVMLDHYEQISEAFLTSSSCHPKFLVKEFSYFLMPCHQHGLGVNLLVQR